MNPLKELLRQVDSELREAEKPWALVGGLAVSSRMEPRFTRDLDMAIAVRDDGEAEELIYRFRHAGYGVLALIEQEAVDRLATVRLNAPGETGIVVDLLFASSGIEPEIVEDAGPVEIASGLEVPVAQLWHLLAMKVLSRDDQRRPQDMVDLRNLLAVVSDKDLDRARGALSLITERGFHRQKDLLADLEELLNPSPQPRT
jgi:predicted nucleotidyltransferase